jgi:hypothetical protein
MKTESVKIDQELLNKYREASKKTGISIGRLVADAMLFFPLEKFVKQIALERSKVGG